MSEVQTDSGTAPPENSTILVPVDVGETNAADEATRLWPAFGKYRKFIASLVATSVPFAVYLCDPRTTKEVIAAAGAYVLTNLGVYGVSND